MKHLVWIALCAYVLAASPALAAGIPTQPGPETVPPTDIATGAAEPSETSAVVLGYFNYGGSVPVGIAKDCWFEYGTTLAYGSRETAICSGTTKATLAALVPGTTYHYRAAASNSAGTTHGPDKTFTTLGLPPGSKTLPPGKTAIATLKVVPGQSLASVLRTGLRLRVALTGSCPCVVGGNLLLSRATAKRLGIKHSRSIALSPGKPYPRGTARVILKLKSSVRRKLRHIRAMKATATVTVTDASGRPTVLSHAVRVTRKR
jgi:hypothetical protein